MCAALVTLGDHTKGSGLRVPHNLFDGVSRGQVRLDTYLLLHLWTFCVMLRSAACVCIGMGSFVGHRDRACTVYSKPQTCMAPSNPLSWNNHVGWSLSAGREQ